LNDLQSSLFTNLKILAKKNEKKQHSRKKDAGQVYINKVALVIIVLLFWAAG
jgi:hypothetical protein